MATSIAIATTTQASFRSKSAPVGCTSDADCLTNNAKCQQGSCQCINDFVGSTCQFPNPCKTTNPCLNSGVCIPDPSDGSSYCDCPQGYTSPLCEPQDICANGSGARACLNGGTCTEKGPFDYICQCRIPFVGELCEAMDLCEIPEEQCIEDLYVAGLTSTQIQASPDSFCYPCVVESSCTQVNVWEYACSCSAGINHTNCLRGVHGPFGRIRMPTPDRQAHHHSGGNPADWWNPIIPGVALGTCGLYVILLFIFFLCLRKPGKGRPQLVVECDIQEFDYYACYLISVETGNGWGAGTDGYIYCYLCGENGNAGPFPLNDANLKPVHVLQRAQEDNYLISCPSDLGHIHKLVICYDNKHHTTSSWDCQQVTILNVKSGDIWFFFMSMAIAPTTGSIVTVYEFPSATKEFMNDLRKVKVNCKHYLRQLTRYHSYISPFIFPTSWRITLLFGEIMMYMLLLICLYGFLEFPDPDIHGALEPYIVTELSFRYIIWKSAFAALGILYGIFFAILFECYSGRRIPTLIAWTNMPLENQAEEEVEIPAPPPIVSDRAINTEPYPPPKRRIKRRKQVQVPVPPQGLPAPRRFRIPSTNIPRLEHWIFENAKGTSGPGELDPEDLVHDSTTFQDKMPSFPESNMDLMNNASQSKAELNTAEHSNYHTVEIEISDEEDEMPPPPQPEDISKAGGDSLPPPPPPRKKVPKRKSNNYYELVAMDYKGEGCKSTPCFIFGWILSLGTILATVVICCIYGGRYGYRRTHDWLLSLLFSILWNLLAYQFIKIFCLVIIVTVLVERKKLVAYEAQKIRRRFQMYNLEGEEDLDDLPATYKLKYVRYPRKAWKPVPDYVKLPSPPSGPEEALT